MASSLSGLVCQLEIPVHLYSSNSARARVIARKDPRHKLCSNTNVYFLVLDQHVVVVHVHVILSGSSPQAPSMRDDEMFLIASAKSLYPSRAVTLPPQSRHAKKIDRRNTQNTARSRNLEDVA